MRALLVLNPKATTTDERVREVIASALASALDLDVTPTKQRGHATHLAAGAVHEGVEAVFILGGDGTVNEVIQALAGTSTLVGIIPGGSTNVFARALGLPNDPVTATGVLLSLLRERRTRAITLGLAAGRYFGFNAGFGFDAAVVRRVEQHHGVKRALRQLAFVWSAGREWFGGRGRNAAPVTVRLPDGTDLGPYAISIVANTDPYTYLGSRSLHVHPRASFDLGLDLVAIRPLSTARLLAIVVRVFRGGSHVDSRHVTYLHDQHSFSLTAARPLPLMVDGDYAGEHTEVEFAAVPRALTVLAPT